MKRTVGNAIKALLVIVVMASCGTLSNGVIERKGKVAACNYENGRYLVTVDIEGELYGYYDTEYKNGVIVVTMAEGAIINAR